MFDGCGVNALPRDRRCGERRWAACLPPGERTYFSGRLHPPVTAAPTTASALQQIYYVQGRNIFIKGNLHVDNFDKIIIVYGNFVDI